MRNAQTASRTSPDRLPRVHVLRRQGASPESQAGSVERKLQADVAAWLRERRAAR